MRALEWIVACDPQKAEVSRCPTRPTGAKVTDIGELPAIDAVELHAEWCDSGDRYVRAMFHIVHSELVAGGLDGLKASEVALGITRQVFPPELGFAQGEAADVLGISRRTAAYDIERACAANGGVWKAATKPLPPVPVPEGGRIELDRRPRHLRAVGW